MKKKATEYFKHVGYYIIASAIVWGAVIVGCSLKLKGTPYYEEISPILFGGVIVHLILIWTPLGVMLRKLKDE
ncbi:MAG: hypothetical protein H8E34_02990 [Bacteroidetes bacterium]|nr:hypothetical protein [Bacteroidota bacterium]MBL6942900.1 hypothetical protein [Bacteroidales bacterium]